MILVRRAALRFWNSDLLVSWGGIAVRLASIAIVLPAVLILFSPAEAALWLLASLIIGLAQTASFGLQITFARVLAYGMAGRRVDQIPSGNKGVEIEPAPAGPGSPNAETLGRLVSVLVATGAALALVSLFLGALAAQISAQPILEELGAPVAGQVAVILTILTFAGSVWGQIHVAWLMGIGHVLTLRRLELATGVGHSAGLLLVLVFGGGVLALVVMNCFWFWVVILRNIWHSRRLDIDGAFSRARPRFDREVLTRTWPAQWRQGVSGFFTHGILQLSGLVVSAVATPAGAALYLFHLRLAGILSTISQPAFYNRVPAFAALWAQGDLAGLVQTTKWRMRLSYWSYAICYVGVGVVSWAFITRYLRTDYTFDPLLWAVLGLAFFSERIAGMHAQLVMLTNVVPYHLTVLSGSLAILIGAPLALLVGEIGMPLGYMLGICLGFIPFVMRRSYTALPLGWPDYERDTSLYPLLIIVIFSIVTTLI